VFIPKIVPDSNPEWRSGVVTYEYDKSISIPRETLAVLNNHNFYERQWSPTIISILNRYFDVLINHLTFYTIPLSEAARHFDGLVVARTFGREHPRTYSEFACNGPRPALLDELSAIGRRFVHAQGYANVSDLEPPVLQNAARTVTVPMPAWIFRYSGKWTGDGERAIFLCPGIDGPGGYYLGIYERIKRDFGDLPHVIFGRQVKKLDDPVIQGYLTDDELIALYARAPVFIYPSEEPRHVHYSPIEAMVVGTPVLYRRGGLIDTLAKEPNLPGACVDTVEMRNKAQRLLAGDRALARLISESQLSIVETFSSSIARAQWAAILPYEVRLEKSA
jgi:glycosyltransferase involved in cell wall biosynthesis